MTIKIKLGTRTDTFGAYIRKFCLYFWHNTSWKNGNFICRKIKEIGVQK